MKAHIVKISPEELKEVFPLIGEHILRGIRQSKGRIDVEGFCRLVANGDWLLWGVYVKDDDDRPEFKAVVASELHETPSGMLEASVPFLGGADREDWVYETLEFLEGWAEAAGAERMYIKARRGLMRYLPEYKCKNVILEKNLGEHHGRTIRARRENGHAREHASA